MALTLISCVGLRDPFNQESPRFFGAALASVLKAKPDKVLLITTIGTTEKAQSVKEFIAKLSSTTDVKILDTGLENPSNFADVDVTLRRVLASVARSEGDVLVNLNSGTQQMTICLSVLLATGYLQGKGITVADPQFANVAISPQKATGVEEDPLTESMSEVEARTKVLSQVQIPLIEHIMRSNAITLCERFDYIGARELLEQSKKRKVYSLAAIPVLSVAENLLLLRIGDAERLFAEIKDGLAKSYPVQTGLLTKALNLHPAVIFYRATAIREKTRRIDEFMRCAGLTREACLAYYAAQPSVKQHYESAAINMNASPVVLDLPRLRKNNPALYEHLEAESRSSTFGANDSRHDGDSAAGKTKTTLREPFELMAGTMMWLVSYAAKSDAVLTPIVETLKTTVDLANLRNTYAHTLQETRKIDYAKAASLFKKLRNVLPEYDYETMRQCDPFSICTEIVTDLLRYCDR